MKKFEKSNSEQYFLPKVSDLTTESALGDIIENGIDAFTDAYFTSLRGSNPLLLEQVCLAIRVQVDEGWDPIVIAMHAMGLTHELLRRQAEADKMSDMLL
jgi:hypothetical protein